MKKNKFFGRAKIGSVISKAKPVGGTLAVAQGQSGERVPEKSLPHGTYVQVLETVPAKRVLAVLAHHLSTAFVAFNIHPANWALLDGGVCICPKEGPRSKVNEKLQDGACEGCLIF